MSFQNKTKANASRKLREDQEAKKREEEAKRAKIKEGQLKAKEYAKKQQREIVS